MDDREIDVSTSCVALTCSYITVHDESRPLWVAADSLNALHLGEGVSVGGGTGRSLKVPLEECEDKELVEEFKSFPKQQSTVNNNLRDKKITKEESRNYAGLFF